MELKPIGYVKKGTEDKDPSEPNTLSKLILRKDLAEALDGLNEFSHLFVLFWMHKIERTLMKAHPRGRSDMPLLGIFATRTPYRPNPIGLTLVKILKVDRNVITVQGLDAFHGTPILDLKPFDPWDMTQDIRVPKWWMKLEKEKTTKRN
ncbi:MAG: tRNA (N6-threonylcarbamoyladenosine(37)-N6)-methyltransferase TrmO [Candidatus Bathyarchaeota archaeon]|nr:MAG: tRNA (N6-threonylcarbamoyladenosine(37)-N6)-methyltransferase TrmO [Candidatus Bathyarchaeota archaeon]